LSLCATLALVPADSAAQQQSSAGPVIHSAGAVFEIPDPEFDAPVDMTYRAAFEMAADPTPEKLNVTLNSVARYLNMHAQAGIPVDQVEAAVVVHGPAGWTLVDDQTYRERNGVDNPNGALIAELQHAGVKIVLCGQTAASRGIPRDHLLDGVETALSAMTAFLVLQEEGFRVNPW
ncbi:MAG: DsrE family protein, partial [Longimicrobiales bacterium]